MDFYNSILTIYRFYNRNSDCRSNIWLERQGISLFLLGFFQSLGATLGAIGFLSAGRLGGVYTA